MEEDVWRFLKPLAETFYSYLINRFHSVFWRKVESVERQTSEAAWYTSENEFHGIMY
jgi:hypothetical protein